MANELKNALDQIKTDVAAVTDVQRAMLGQPVDSLPETAHNKATAAIYLVTGRPLNDAYTATKERHRIDIRFYWLLTPSNSEIVEQSAATMWDRMMTKFFDVANRNLAGKATVALVSGAGGAQPYQCGYEKISDKQHRIMIVPLEVELDTHVAT